MVTYVVANIFFNLVSPTQKLKKCPAKFCVNCRELIQLSTNNVRRQVNDLLINWDKYCNVSFELFFTYTNIGMLSNNNTNVYYIDN